METKSKNTINNIIFNAMTEEEYQKALEFYKFLVELTRNNNGFLPIDWEKLIDLASAFMKTSPIDAYHIIMKMKSYGWIRVIDRRFIVVSIRDAVAV